MRKFKLAGILLAGALLLGACGNTGDSEPTSGDNTTGDETTAWTGEEQLTPVSSEPEIVYTEEGTEEAQSTDNGYKQAYIDQIRKCEAEKENDAAITYDLIYIDEDDTPELVAGVDGYYIRLYTYANGQIYALTDIWPYGAGGNAGYQYIPYKNVVENEDADLAGSIRYYTYWKINDNHELVSYYDADLSVWLFDDKNGNGMMDEGEYTEGDNTAYYHYGDQIISEEEFQSYQITGDYQYITGSKSADEMIAQLQQ